MNMLRAKGRTSWFEHLTGFAEAGYEASRARLRVEGDRLHSRANGLSWRIGRLEMPSLERVMNFRLCGREDCQPLCWPDEQKAVSE